MLIPGSLDGDGEWVEPASLARQIEIEMVAADLLDIDDEGEEGTDTRRRTFIAMATAIVQHLSSQLEIRLDPGDLRSAAEGGDAVPEVDKTFNVNGGQVSIGAGSLLAANQHEVQVPRVAKTLVGKVS